MLKANDLTNNLSHIDPYSWQSWQTKKVFRLTIPVLIRIFHLTPYIVVCLQILIGFLTFIFTYKLVYRISKDSVQATLFTFAIAFLYFGKAAFFESVWTWFDGFSYFFLLMAMYSRNIYGIAFFSTLAAWNDERAFIALSIIFLYHYFENNDTKKITYKNLLNVNKNTIAVMIAIIFYIIVRLLLNNLYDMRINAHDANLSMIVKRTYAFIPIGLLTFFEGFYVLIAVFFLFAINTRDYLRLFLVSLSLLIITVVSFSVEDITRSGSFAFPLAFIAIQYLKDKLTHIEIRDVLLLCLVITFIIPPIFISSEWEMKNMLTKPTFIYVLEHLSEYFKHK